MSDIEIKEFWEEKIGGECPAGFIKLVDEYRRRKSVYAPAELGIADFAVCTMLYELAQELAGLAAPAKKGAGNG